MNLASFRASTRPSQAAANAVCADVTIVTAGSSPLAPVREQLPDFDASALIPGASPAGGRAEPSTLTPEPVAEQSLPPLSTQASNLFQAAVAFVGDGCGIVDDMQYRQRLDICRTCVRLQGNRCTACGCWINVKARGRIFRCPIGRWS